MVQFQCAVLSQEWEICSFI